MTADQQQTAAPPKDPTDATTRTTTYTVLVQRRATAESAAARPFDGTGWHVLATVQARSRNDAKAKAFADSPAGPQLIKDVEHDEATIDCEAVPNWDPSRVKVEIPAPLPVKVRF